jgi:hypothetical protein
MAQADQIALTFRCSSELLPLLPRPIPAASGLPDWFTALPQMAFNPTVGEEMHGIKKCPPVIDAMTCGFLIPLAIDLSFQDGKMSWNFDGAEYRLSPISFHDPSQVAGTPFFDDDCYIIKFNNYWTIQAPPGYSLLFTHPINRADLPFTTITGLVDCDTFYDVPVHFPARWHDQKFNGVLPKGTPVAQCVPVKREIFAAHFEVFTEDAARRYIATEEKLARETDVYSRQYRAAKR